MGPETGDDGSLHVTYSRHRPVVGGMPVNETVSAWRQTFTKKAKEHTRLEENEDCRHTLSLLQVAHMAAIARDI